MNKNRFIAILKKDFNIRIKNVTIFTIIYIAVQSILNYNKAKELYFDWYYNLFMDTDPLEWKWYVENSFPTVSAFVMPLFYPVCIALIFLLALNMIKTYWNNNSIYTLIRALRSKSSFFILKIIPPFIYLIFLWLIQLITLVLITFIYYITAPDNTFSLSWIIDNIWGFQFINLIFPIMDAWRLPSIFSVMFLIPSTIIFMLLTEKSKKHRILGNLIGLAGIIIITLFFLDIPYASACIPIGTIICTYLFHLYLNKSLYL